MLLFIRSCLYAKAAAFVLPVRVYPSSIRQNSKNDASDSIVRLWKMSRCLRSISTFPKKRVQLVDRFSNSVAQRKREAAFRFLSYRLYLRFSDSLPQRFLSLQLFQDVTRKAILIHLEGVTRHHCLG